SRRHRLEISPPELGRDSVATLDGKLAFLVEARGIGRRARVDLELVLVAGAAAADALVELGDDAAVGAEARVDDFVGFLVLVGAADADAVLAVDAARDRLAAAHVAEQGLLDAAEVDVVVVGWALEAVAF